MRCTKECDTLLRRPQDRSTEKLVNYMSRNAAQRHTAKFFYLPKSRFEDDKLSPDLHNIGLKAKEREMRSKETREARANGLQSPGDASKPARRRLPGKWGEMQAEAERESKPPRVSPQRAPQVWKWQRREWEQPQRAAERKVRSQNLPARMAGKHGPTLYPFIARQADGNVMLSRRSATSDRRLVKGAEDQIRSASVDFSIYPPGSLAEAHARRDRFVQACLNPKPYTLNPKP